jgi:L-amino acid N-acyltransferase YncA
MTTSARIRLATANDGAAVAAIYRPYVEATPISFELRPPTADEMAGRIARLLEFAPWLVAEVGGIVRGYAYAGRFRDRPAYDWTAESAVYVDADARGRGLGRLLMAALIRVLKLQGYRTVIAGITLPNEASVALHEALGFERIGQFGKVGWKADAWHGVDFYALELGPRVDGEEPAALRPLPGLVGTGELALALWPERP